MLALHVAAHTVSRTPVRSPEAADWLWLRLRAAFPSVIAACLMPDHLHLLLSPECAAGLSSRLGRVLGGFSRHVGLPLCWAPVAEPTPIPNLEHLRRTVRYIHMNPWREGLVTDPLCWPWSTHRDAIGARYSPWLDAPTLAQQLRFGASRFAETFHQYATKDRDLEPEIKEFPRPLQSVGVPALAPSAVAAAIRASGLYLEKRVRARLLAHAARREGWPVGQFSKAAGMTARSMQRYARDPHPLLLTGVPGGPDACAMCLGDWRLRFVPSRTPAGRSPRSPVVFNDIRAR